MLSVLIPIYNFDVRLLVSELYDQLEELKIPFEIRCYDDGSYFDFRMNNQRIAAYPNVTYRELPENIGRSKIRNKLASEAQYEYLLFLDCDGMCGENPLIRKYLEQLGPNRVLCGGRLYAKEIPSNSNLILHWKYGSEREVISFQKRAKKPYKGFQSNNFLIAKALFESIKFDENITGYGHEDTLFGQALKARGVEILHMDNPVLHMGLKTTHHFLESTQQAIHNLAYMIRNGLADKSISLYRAYRTIAILRLEAKFYRKFDRNRNYYLNQLYSTEPDLKKLDKLKLLWLMEEMKKD